MTITLPPEIETEIADQAQKEGVAPEQLAPNGLRTLFVSPKLTPDEMLALAAQVYAGLSHQEVGEVEKAALDRSHFADARSSEG